MTRQQLSVLAGTNGAGGGLGHGRGGQLLKVLPAQVGADVVEVERGAPDGGGVGELVVVVRPRCRRQLQGGWRGSVG